MNKILFKPNVAKGASKTTMSISHIGNSPNDVKGSPFRSPCSPNLHFPQPLTDNSNTYPSPDHPASVDSDKRGGTFNPRDAELHRASNTPTAPSRVKL